LETEDITAASSAYFATPLSLSRVGLPARQEKFLVLAQRCWPQIRLFFCATDLCNRPVGFVRLKQRLKVAGCPGSGTCRCAILGDSCPPPTWRSPTVNVQFRAEACCVSCMACM